MVMAEKKDRASVRFMSEPQGGKKRKTCRMMHSPAQVSQISMGLGLCVGDPNIDDASEKQKPMPRSILELITADY